MAVNKKAQMMHMWGATDIFIIILGIAIGIGLIYFLRDNSMVQNLICGGGHQVSPPAP
ncbi:MAG: hypothetical protein QXQ79_01210 [Candidatus Nanoarchaeia archaeon]